MCSDTSHTSPPNGAHTANTPHSPQWESQMQLTFNMRIICFLKARVIPTYDEKHYLCLSLNVGSKQYRLY